MDFSSQSAPQLGASTVVAGKYRLIRPLRAGGVGAVWLARNEATGGDVALKVLRGSDGAHDLGARLRREALATGRLAHRGIVRTFDLIEIGTQVGLVMELLRGKTLADHLRERGKMGVDDAVSTVLAILGALEHAHTRGVVHRDLKPANVFLAVDPDGVVTPKLLDFGLSKVCSPPAPIITPAGQTVGTPSYMSPEQVRGEEWVDARSDLFNVGILLYEMLSGRNPFVVGSFHSRAAVLEAQPKPFPEAPPALWQVIERALTKSPVDRFSSARELSAALRNAMGLADERASQPPEGLALAGLVALAHAPVLAPSAPISAPRTRRARWGGVATALGAAALAAGAAAVLVLWWSAAREPRPRPAALASDPVASTASTPIVERSAPASPQAAPVDADAMLEDVIVPRASQATDVVPASSEAPPRPRATAAPLRGVADKPRLKPVAIPLPSKPPPKLIARNPGF